ncbi:hypothetical protein JCM5350_003869 [Sporobolomyces pararoseus]
MYSDPRWSSSQVARNDKISRRVSERAIRGILISHSFFSNLLLLITIMSLSDLDFLHQTLASQSSSRPTRSTEDTSEGTTSITDGFKVSDQATGDESTPTPSLASLLATLQATTTSTNTTLNSEVSPEEEEGQEMNEEDLLRMLEKLNEAEGAADDLEGRLDGLIGNLDQMLSLLGVSPEEDLGGGEEEGEKEEEEDSTKEVTSEGKKDER